MKKAKLFVALLLVCVMMSAMMLVACNAHTCEHPCEQCGKCTNAECTQSVCSNKCPGHTPPPVVSITIDKESLSMDVYDVAQLTANVENSTEAVVWTSSASNVATVDNGLVKAIAEGTATITATVGGKSDTCIVTVVDSHTAPVMILDRTSISVAKDDTYQVEVSVLWKGEPITNEEIAYTWALAGQSDIAEISNVGATATVTGKEYGTTSFTVSATVRGHNLQQTLDVKVCGVDITFDISNVEIEGTNNVVNIPLVQVGDLTPSFVPEISVMRKGEPVADATLVWTSSQPEIVAVEDGAFVAKSEGEAVLTADFEGNSVSIIARTYRPEIATENHIYFELADAKNIALGDGYQGQLVGFAIEGSDVELQVADGALVYEQDKVAGIALGSHTGIIETDKAYYTVEFGVYTKVLRTAEDIDAWGALARTDVAGKSNGYFILGNDIEFNKVYEGDTQANEFSEFWLYDSVGFAGTFDGRGYNINGMEIGPEGSFIRCLTTGGVIKNVSFTNVVIQDGGLSVLTVGCAGTIENVYVHCVRQPSNTAIFVSHDSTALCRINNCFADTTLVEGATGAYVIGKVWDKLDVVNDVYAVGTTNMYSSLGDGWLPDNPNVCAGYATVEELKAANIDFSAWNSAMWAIVDGVPTPNCLNK